MKRTLAALGIGIGVLVVFLFFITLIAEGCFDAAEATGWRQVAEAGAVGAWCLGLLLWTGVVGSLVWDGIQSTPEDSQPAALAGKEKPDVQRG